MASDGIEQQVGWLAQELAQSRQATSNALNLLASRWYDTEKALKDVKTAIELNSAQYEDITALKDVVELDRADRMVRQATADRERRQARRERIAILALLLVVLVVVMVLEFDIRLIVGTIADAYAVLP